jgi:hypothetical protein
MEKPFGHEPDAINYRTIVIGAGVLAVVVIAIAVGLHLILTRAVIPNHAEIAARPAQIPPKPRLQAHPQADLAKFRAEKQAPLSGYAWTNAQHDYARIPIQRAMQIYAAQHAHPASPSTSGSAPASASSGATPAAQGART